MNISHISVSRRDVWKLCKQKYKYKYHLKLESLEEEPFYFVYGKIIHKIAEEFVSKRGELGLPQIAKDVLEGRIPIEENKDGSPLFAPPLPIDYKTRMSGHIGSIRRLTEQIGFDGELEYPFEFDLDPPNNKKVVGFIDRLINKNGNWFIIDYKTTKKGQWRKNSKTVLHDLQLRCYARIVQKTFGAQADQIRAALYYLEGGDLIAAQFSQDSLDSAEQELLDVYNEIHGFNPDDAWGCVGDWCHRCEYRKICPFYNR